MKISSGKSGATSRKVGVADSIAVAVAVGVGSTICSSNFGVNVRVARAVPKEASGVFDVAILFWHVVCFKLNNYSVSTNTANDDSVIY